MRFFATNGIDDPGGNTVHLAAHEYGILVVAYAHPEDFFSAADVPLARDALRQQLYENVPAAQAVAQRLSPAGRARMERLLAHKADLSDDLLGSLTNHAAEAEAVSPAGKLAHIQADVLLAHGTGDNVIPPSELLWLARDIPADRLKAALISPAISHVELGGKPTFMDEWRLVHFMEELLGEVKQHAHSRHAPVPRQPIKNSPATPGID
jgi:pimeloyl-ACP methyl ester carboxylesterase